MLLSAPDKCAGCSEHCTEFTCPEHQALPTFIFLNLSLIAIDPTPPMPFIKSPYFRCESFMLRHFIKNLQSVRPAVKRIWETNIVVICKGVDRIGAYSWLIWSMTRNTSVSRFPAKILIASKPLNLKKVFAPLFNTFTAAAIFRKLGKNSKLIFFYVLEYKITCSLTPWKGTQSTSYFVVGSQRVNKHNSDSAASSGMIGLPYLAALAPLNCCHM